MGIGFFPPNDAGDVLPPANNSELIKELEDDERVTGEKSSVRLKVERALTMLIHPQLGLYDCPSLLSLPSLPSLPAIGQTLKIQSKASSWENCYAKA